MTIRLFFVLFVLTMAFASCKNSEKESTHIDEQLVHDSLEGKQEVPSADIKIPKYDEVITDYYDDGGVFTVEYFEKDGNYDESVFRRKYYRSGNVFIEGDLFQGQRHNKWIAWYDNGMVWSMATYYKGDKHGESKVYYENGQLRYTQKYDQGVPNGLWQFYCPDGILLGEIMYEEGIIAYENNFMEE